jgi:hypothetical protein
MAFTMACPNFKKALKMAFGPLGVNASNLFSFTSLGMLEKCGEDCLRL